MARRQMQEVRSEEEFEQKLIDLARVTRVVAGGKRMRFRACLVIGNKKGQIGYGIAKGNDVALAMGKALRAAKKNLIDVNILNGVIPHEIRIKYKSAKIILKPATAGKGIKAGGVMRIILELGGIESATGKILGSKNKINNVRATFLALTQLKPIEKKEESKVKEKKNDENNL
jgi:small subunit ribosomal protein S5